MRVVAVSGVVLCLGAQGRAADLSGSPPAPRLGTCDTETGGFRLPGTEGCLRVNGLVSAEAGWAVGSAPATLSRGVVANHPRATGADLSRSAVGVGTRLSADVRLPTDLGPVRAYMSLRARDGSLTDRVAR